MRITVNGAARDLPDDATVATAIALLTGTPDPRGVAVAVNNEVVARTRWETTALRDGDAVEALTAVPGG